MVTENIFREPTNDEKKDMKIVGSKDLSYYFRQKNIKKENEYTLAHKPYCYRCAKIDFEKNVSDALREKSLHTDDDKEIDVDKIYAVDLDKYADPKRFELLRTEEVNEDKLVDGMRASVLTGYKLSYKCVERGCGICVFVPLKDYEERIKPKVASTKK